MKMRAGKGIAGAVMLAVLAGTAPANAQGLSEKAIRTFMEYAWSLTPQQFSKPDGTVIQIDKTKKAEILPTVEEALEIIKAGRLSAHAQMCELRDEQVANHRALMRRELAKKKWTPQQEVYISQLHLTTVMLLNGKIKLVEKEGDKEVIVDETKESKNTCTDDQKQKIREMIIAYIKASPNMKVIEGNPPPSETGSTSKAAGQE